MYAPSTSAGPDRFQAPTAAEQAAEPAPFDALDSSIAEDRALANVDSYTDWLASECIGVMDADSTDVLYQVLLPTETFDVGMYQLKIDAATVPQLLHITLTASSASRAWPAQCELKRRYLAAQGL